MIGWFVMYKQVGNAWVCDILKEKLFKKKPIAAFMKRAAIAKLKIKKEKKKSIAAFLKCSSRLRIYSHVY